MSSRAAKLAQSDLFRLPHRSTSLRERTELTYKRARAIAKLYGRCLSSFLAIVDNSDALAALTAYDCHFLTDKFWAMHLDNIAGLDLAAFTLLTIQYNLVIGTLAPHASKRPELRPVLQQLLDFDVS